jgi:hypothetical protein
VDAVTTKQCNKCGEVKPLDQFSKDKHNKTDGKAARCKLCARADCHKWYEANKEKVAEKNREYWPKYRAENQERLLEYGHNYYEANKEKLREPARERSATWRREHPDKAKEVSRRYWANHGEEVNQRIREHYANNQSEYRAYHKEWRKANPARIRNYGAARRTKKSVGDGISAADLADIRASQTDKRGRLICWKWGKPIKDNPHLDHWMPLNRDGEHSPGNVHYMHARCNTSKSDKHPFEIGRLL